MEDTLDTYSISKKLIATNNLKPQEYSKLLESNAYEAFISLLNNHEISYNIGNYLFKAEQPLGEKAIRIFYKFVSEKTPVIYVCYTNVCHVMTSSRMVQGIWAFPNEQIANKWKNEMLKMNNYVNNSHLIQLPLAKIVNSKKYPSVFIDPYYETDRSNFVNHYLETHQEEVKEYRKMKLMHNLRVHKIAKEELAKIAILPNKSHLFEAMAEYNNDADQYIANKLATDIDHDPQTVKVLLKRARGLNERFYELHSDYSSANKLREKFK